MNLSEIEKNLEDGESQMYFLNVDLKRSTDKLLVFRKFPFSQWAIGLGITVMGSVMMHFLIHGTIKDLNVEWYHYITAVVIIFLGLIFIVYGRIHILEIDKNA
jgi:cytochrome c biogenesis protein CcdA